MYCSQCGRLIAEDSAFCAGCGKKVDGEPKPQAFATIQPVTVKNPTGPPSVFNVGCALIVGVIILMIIVTAILGHNH